MPSIFDDDYAGPVTPNPSIFNTDEENVILDQGHGGQQLEDVRRIQQQLKAAGFDPGPIDGLWGPKTCAAMLHFQQRYFGTDKHGFLDYETFKQLNFDTMTADRFALRYGFACGATVVPLSEEERRKQYPPGEGVSQADITEIQKRLGVLQTGTFNVTTCKELFRIQQNNGNMQTVLLSSTFERLGYTGTEAKRLASGFAASCAQYWIDLTEKKQPVEPKAPEPVEPVTPVTPGYQKAGFPWVLGILGGVAAAGILWTALKKKKR